MIETLNETTGEMCMRRGIVGPSVANDGTLSEGIVADIPPGEFIRLGDYTVTNLGEASVRLKVIRPFPGEDRPALEIEITDAMIEAGQSAIWGTPGLTELAGLFSSDDLACGVYRAMERCRRSEDVS